MWNLIKQFLITSIEANKAVTNHSKRSVDYINNRIEGEEIELSYLVTNEKLKENTDFTRLSYYVAQHTRIKQYLNNESRNS